MKSREVWKWVLFVVFVVASFSQWFWKPYSDLVAAFVMFGGALFLLLFWVAFNNAGRPYPCEYLESGKRFVILKVEDCFNVMMVKKLDGSLKDSIWLVRFPEKKRLTSKDERGVFVIIPQTPTSNDSNDGCLFFLH
ncbi:MAG: hypothetical protein AAB494_00015 [Patescibacteria group bacterium]